MNYRERRLRGENGDSYQGESRERGGGQAEFIAAGIDAFGVRMPRGLKEAADQKKEVVDLDAEVADHLKQVGDLGK